MGLPHVRSVRNASSNRTLYRVACLLPAALCLLVLPNLVGCNNGKQLQADLYQRELRLQEDEIYRLEDNVEEYQAIVRGYRCEVSDLKRELAEVQPQPQVITPAEGPRFQPTPVGEIDIQPFKAPQIESVPEEPLPRTSSPKVEPLKFRPAPDAPEAPVFTPGADTIQLDRAASLALHEEAKSPARKKSKANAAAAKVVLLGDAMPPLPFPATKARPIAELPFEPLPLETLAIEHASIELAPYEEPMPRVEETILDEAIVLNELATPLLKLAAVDSVQVDLQNGPRETSGEATLVARLSPLSSGEPAYFEGEASVLIADMSQRGSRRRIGRWDFTTDEVAQAWAEDSTQLELPLLLPAELISKMPTDRPLRLWVRLVDSRGHKTLHSMDVDFLDHPWRLAETRPLEAIQARPIEMASLSLRRLPIESTEPSEESTQERVAQADPAQTKEASPIQSGWKRAVLHRSNARTTSKRDDAVRPATYTFPAETAGL